MRPLLCFLLLVCLIPLSSTTDAATFLYFKSEPGDYIGMGMEQIWTTHDGTFTVERNFDNGVSIDFIGSDWSDWCYLDFAAPNDQQLQPGAYESATRFPFQSPTEPGLSIVGDGRGCNTVTGRFDILEVTYSGSGKVESFAADFEQHCEGIEPALFGSIRFNATTADPLDHWHWRNPLPQGNDLNGLAYGEGTFVVVGAYGTILTSSDGATWISRVSGTTNPLGGVAFGNETFVAVGGQNSGTILTSPDGITWTNRTPGTASWLFGVTFANSTFVAVGNRTILVSPDGITWTKTSVIGSDAVTYGNNTFVAVGGNATIVTSPDGASWTSRASATGENLTGVAFGNNTFVAVGWNGTIMTSPDGVTWTSRASGIQNHLFGVDFVNDRFVAVGHGGRILTSSDGVTWTNQASGVIPPLLGVGHGNALTAAVGIHGIILTSLDTITWELNTSGTTQWLYGAAYGNDTFVAVGSAGILTSSDGITWTGPYEVNNELRGVVHGNNAFVAVGSGPIFISNDGLTWTDTSPLFFKDLSDVTYGNNLFVAVGGSGKVLTSPDGATWTSRTSGTGEWLSGVAFGNGIYVVVGYYGTILTSNDGFTWTTRTSGVNRDLYSVAYGNGNFVAYGSKYVRGSLAYEDAMILTSADGVTWKGTPISQDLWRLRYGNNIFVAVGGTYGCNILTSPDGVNWTERSSVTNNSLDDVAFGRNTFLTVGIGGSILQSDPLLISTTPSFLDFGMLNVGDISVPKTLTITNLSGSDLVIDSTLIRGPILEDFVLQSDLCSSKTLVPAGNCTVEVSFSPKSQGLRSAFATILSNTSNGWIFDVLLKGTGITPNVSVTPSAVNFGNVTVGSSVTSTLTISNLGTADLVVGTLTLTGTAASEFSLQDDNCSGHAVAPSSSCSVKSVFSPLSGGSKSAALSIPFNDPDTPTLNVPLSGVGTLGSPGAATLISPSGMITATTPTYTWDAVPGAAGYYLWVNDSTGNKIKQGYTPSAAGCPSGTGTCSVTPSTALAAGVGTWWILTYNSAGLGPWSAGMSFTVAPPGQATLVSPSGAIDDTTPTYVWNAVLGSTWYHLWVNDSTGNKINQWFKAADVDCPDGTGTCSVTPTTEVIGSCQWYVQTYNPAGFGPWTLPGMSFATPIPTLPPTPAPTLISPSEAITDTTPTYTWNPVANATWYHLWVNDSTGNKINQWFRAADVGCPDGTGTCSITPTTEVIGSCQWYIQTYNPAGFGPWSLPGMSFTTPIPTLPPTPAPTLISPSEAITDTTPTYTWNPVANATWYHLWVNDSTGNKINQWFRAADVGCPDGTGTCSVAPTTEVVGSCKWWVQTYNSAGFGPWSGPLSFTTTAPIAAILVSPAGTITETTPTYTWNAVPGATWYQLYVNDSTGNRIQKWYTASEAGCSSGNSTCSVTPTPFLIGAGDWKIQTYDSAGYGPWSSSLSFNAPSLSGTWVGILIGVSYFYEPDLLECTIDQNGNNLSGMIRVDQFIENTDFSGTILGNSAYLTFSFWFEGYYVTAALNLTPTAFDGNSLSGNYVLTLCIYGFCEAADSGNLFLTKQ